MEQAIILAGGQATRMRPYTEKMPKAMALVGDAPILGYQLHWLAANGIKTVILSIGYRADIIQAYGGDGALFGLEIRYAVETEPRGRGGGLKLAASHLPMADAPAFVLNGDIITRFPLAELTAQHERLGVPATVALAPYRSNWGVAQLDGHLIRNFEQSPWLPYWINAGVYAIQPSIVELLPDVGDHEDTTFPQLARGGRLGAFKIEGYWRGVDTTKDLKTASGELAEIGWKLPERYGIGRLNLDIDTT